VGGEGGGGLLHGLVLVRLQLHTHFNSGEVLDDVGLLGVVDAAPHHADVERVGGLVGEGVRHLVRNFLVQHVHLRVNEGGNN